METQEIKTDQYNISVLLPTRGRREVLQTSLLSLFEHADHPERCELLLAFDQDDQISSDYFTSNIAPDLDDLGVTYAAYEFERLGYIRLNEYINAIAAHSRGRWLMFWGDDAVMESQGWDTEIVSVPDFRVLRIPTHNQHPYAIWPIVPRAWYDLFGYMSPHQLTDTWVSQVAYLLDIMQNIPVQATHDRFDLTGNNNDETFANRPMLEGRPGDPRDFNHVNWRQRRLEDCERLSIMLESQGQDMSWWKGVKAGTQDAWAKMCSREFDPNGQVSSFA